jgi:acyl-CoA thioesterase-1
MRSPVLPLLACLALTLLPACGPAGAQDRGDAQMLDRGPEGALAPAAAEAQIPEDAPVVAFLGDSITAGLHLPQDSGFPALVQRALVEAGLPFQVVLAGVSGDTSAGGLRRIDWVLRSRPDVVIIELGGNDGLRGKPVADIKDNLGGIVERVREAGSRPLLVGMLLPPNYGLAYTSAFAGLYGELADELDVPLVPDFMRAVGFKPELMMSDMIHPNTKGHGVLAEVLAPHLAELLEELDDA